MKILSLNIVEFAGLTDLKLEFNDGINVIEGLNESGKSTVNAFIKFMLYGLDNSKCNNTSITEKKYYTSWKNGLAQGIMTVLFKNKYYRIERKGVMGSVYRDTCDIFDVKTGEKVFKGREPGEIFLGIAAPIYESTCCIRQRELTEVDGRGVSDAIQNMLISADKNINLDRSCKKLNDVRKSLLLQKGEGGRIYELSREIEGLTVRLDRAEKASRDIRVQRETAESKRELVRDLRLSLNSAEEKLKAFDDSTLLRKFNELHEAEKDVGKLENSIAALDADFNDGNLIPTQDVADTLIGYGRKIPGAEADYDRASAFLEQQKNVPSPDVLKTRSADRIKECGGMETVLTGFSRLKKKIRALLITAIILMSFGGVISVASVILGILLSPFIFAVLAVGISMITVSSLLFVRRFKTRKKLSKYLENAGYFSSKIPNIYNLDSYLSECIKAKRETEKRKEIIEAAEAACESKKAYLEGILSEAAAVLATYTDSEIPSKKFEDREKLIGLIDDAVTKIRGFIVKREALISELSFKKRIAASLKESLIDKDEEFIRKNLTPDLLEAIKGRERDSLLLSRNYLSEQIKGCDHAREEAEKRLISLESSNEDPLSIACVLEEKRTELDRLKLSLDAILLAMQTIDDAGKNLRQGVAPRLCKGASERMAELTNGKYDGLSVDSNASLSITTDMTRDIGVLSAGTRDAAYLSLRFSMIDILFGERKPCITIDEGLSQLDDVRARSMLSVLESYCEGGGQCILFTCHSREATILSEMNTEHKIQKLA